MPFWRLDEAGELSRAESPIAFTELKQQQPKLPELRLASPRVMVARKAKKGHPWRQGYQNMKPRIPNQVIATPLVGMRTYASP